METKTIDKLLKLIICLCLSDGILTIIWVDAGIAKEANPFMEIFLTESYLLFMAVKLSLTFLGIIVLNKHKKKNRYIQYLILLLTIIYIFVNIYHIIGFILSG